MRTNCVLAGVGGQGILFITKILHDAALTQGFRVMVSETHGMAQRGGSVVSHLRIGDMGSPLVRSGTADVLLVFEYGELSNTVGMLKRGGAAVVNRPSEEDAPSELQTYLKARGVTPHYMDAYGAAAQMGSPLTANVILLGFALSRLSFPMPFESVKETVERLSKEAFRGKNVEALRAGYDWSENGS